MIHIYVECQGNTRTTAIFYSTFFLGINCKDRSYRRWDTPSFWNQLCRTWTPNKYNIRIIPDDALEFAILNSQLCAAEKSEWTHMSACLVSISFVKRTCAHPYNPIFVQALMLLDHIWRFDYCNFPLNTSEENMSFFYEILYTDERTITWGCIVNMHNTYYWSLENPTQCDFMHAGQRTWNAAYGEHLLLDPFSINGILTSNC